MDFTGIGITGTSSRPRFQKHSFIGNCETKAHAHPALQPLPRINSKENSMKSIVLWILGVPLSVIILLKVFGVY